jgi:hypothetical protein
MAYKTGDQPNVKGYSWPDQSNWTPESVDISAVPSNESTEEFIDPDYFDVTDSDQVGYVQNMLNKLGFADQEGNALVEDAMFGNKTEYAWRNYVNQLREREDKDQYVHEERPGNSAFATTDEGKDMIQRAMGKERGVFGYGEGQWAPGKLAGGLLEKLSGKDLFKGLRFRSKK